MFQKKVNKNKKKVKRGLWFAEHWNKGNMYIVYTIDQEIYV